MRIPTLFAATLLLFMGAGIGQDEPLPPPFVRPERGSDEYKEYAKEKDRLSDLMRPLEAEYAGLFSPTRSRFEGNWKFSGTRETRSAAGATPVIEPFKGEGYIYYYDGGSPYQGTIKISGKLQVQGERKQSLSGSSDKPDHEHRDDDEPVVYPFGDGQTSVELDVRTKFLGDSGKGTMTFTREGDEIRFKAVSEDEIDGQPVVVVTVGKGVRFFNKTQAEIEEELIELYREDQQLRYPRPEPGEYTSPSGKLHARFAPTVEFDPHGIEAELLALIDSAKETLDVCLYEIGLHRFSEALIRARDERGVKVRLVNDNHNHGPHEQMVATKILMAAGMDRVIDDRSALMHNKFIIVDGKKLWTGSTNVTYNGVYKQDNNALLIESPELIKEYQTEFNEMFEGKEFGPTSTPNTRWSKWHEDPALVDDWVKIDGETEAQVYFAPEDDPMGRLIDSVQRAEHSVHIMAFRFTSHDLLKILLDKMKNDPTFEVTVVMEDKAATATSTKQVVRPLLAAGATVRFDASPEFLHHKVAIIDETVVATGSFNFSASAQDSNDENLLLLRSESLAQAFLREQRIILAMGDPNHPEIAPYTPGNPNFVETNGLEDALEGAEEDEEEFDE
ncbi:MAG: phospholipase D-like domain-containing protein [Planctomycetota bacterium]